MKSCSREKNAGEVEYFLHFSRKIHNSLIGVYMQIVYSYTAYNDTFDKFAK